MRSTRTPAPVIRTNQLTTFDRADAERAAAAAGVPHPAAPERWAVVVDAAVSSHPAYARRLPDLLARLGVRHELLALDVGEIRQTPEALQRVLRHLQDTGIRVQDRVVAIGGGAVVDLVATAADLHAFGTPCWSIPTSLAAMVDGAAGSHLSLVDPAFLATLPPRHVSAGLASMVRLGLATDAFLFELLEHDGALLLAQRFQGTSPEGKAAADRAIGMTVRANRELAGAVPLGDALTPWIEIAAPTELLYGEALALDLALTLVLAADRPGNRIIARDRDRLLRLLHRLGLPLWHDALTPALLANALDGAPPHCDGTRHLAVGSPLGAVHCLTGVTPGELRRAVHTLRRRAADCPEVAPWR